MTLVRRVAAVVVAAALGLAGGGCGGDDAATLPEGPFRPVGGGPAVDLAAGTGTPTVVNLWATWCVPCRVELPAFDDVAARADGRVDVLGVNVGEDEAWAAELVAELDLGFPQLLDPRSELTAALGVSQMPTTAFVDADGTVVEVHPGVLDEGELEDAIAEHLGVRLG